MTRTENILLILCNKYPYNNLQYYTLCIQPATDNWQIFCVLKDKLAICLITSDGSGYYSRYKNRNEQQKNNKWQETAALFWL